MSHISINDFIEKLSSLWHYACYLITAKHRNGHGIHSPFVYELVNKVLFDKTHYPEYNKTDDIRRELLNSRDAFYMDDLGAKSLHFKNNKRYIRDLVFKSSIKSKFGKLLFRLVRYYQPEIIVELGTSLGISSAYMALGHMKSKIYTIEGNETLCSCAHNLFKKYNLNNIQIFQGDFDAILSKTINEHLPFQLVFIDGNHQYKAILRYFEYFVNRMNDGIIVIDDINWSGEMRKAWTKIVNDPRAPVTIDLYFIGIIIIRKSLTYGHYKVIF